MSISGSIRPPLTSPELRGCEDVTTGMWRGPWATFFAVFRTQCPRARSRYHNRINVYLSHPVTLLLSRVRQAGFAVNTRLEGEAVPDSRLWGFYPRHLWNNDRNACLRVVVLLFFFRRFNKSWRWKGKTKEVLSDTAEVAPLLLSFFFFPNKNSEPCLGRWF